MPLAYPKKSEGFSKKIINKERELTKIFVEINENMLGCWRGG